MPALSVLMTVYNGMPYLKDAVESVLSQTLRDVIFLILNNGSTDGTRAYLDSLPAGGGPTLRVVHLPENIGRTAVLNKGLSLVETDYTAIIDADDIAFPPRLARQCDFLREHPEIDLVGSDVVYINREGVPTGGEQYPAEHAALVERLPLYNQFSHAACMFRTAAAVRAGGYPAAFPYAQDFALWIAMLREGSRVASIPEPLAAIRVHPGQATRDSALLAVRGEDNRRLAEAMLDIPGFSPAARQAAQLRAAGALFHLGRRGEAFFTAVRAVKESPALVLYNHLLWRRAALWLRRRLAKVFR